jgi:RimJ/RimL family protein N-acetyltransferase
MVGATLGRAWLRQVGGGGESYRRFHRSDWPEGEHKTEVGWLRERFFWGRGLATEGARVIVRPGFEKLELERIISIIHPENAASRRVAEKAGLTYQGETCWRGLAKPKARC